MAVSITIDNIEKVPETCMECPMFSFNGMSENGQWLFDSVCQAVRLKQMAEGKEVAQGELGWVGEDISQTTEHTGYYAFHHCVDVGTRAKQCPLS